MGKKSRKTRAKTKDFQKVKLKVGKRKPQANNVTETGFKSQAIYIPEQLKNVTLDHVEEQEDVLNHRKQSVQDLLSQTGHFSSNVRTDALTGLKVHLSNNKQLIPLHLPKIIEKLPRMIVDEDQQVRRSSMTVFRVLFSSLSDKQISPFFDIIIFHLHCAMSHIYEDVQRDSLQVIDLILEFYPNLMTEKTRNSLLEHFIELISRKQRSTAVGGFKNQTGDKNTGQTRVLSMKLSKKETSISWRIKILSRLFALLSSSDKKEEYNIFSKTMKKECGDFNYDVSNGVIVPWNSKNIGQILTSYRGSWLSAPGLSLRSNPMNILSTLNPEIHASSPWQLMTTLFPLLFDSWHEVLSDEKKSLDAETVSTMVHVLNIVVFLCKMFVDTSDDKVEAIIRIRSTFLKNFHHYFTSVFPLHHHGISTREKRMKKRADKQTETKMQDLQEDIQNVNLSICELFTLLATEEELQHDAPMLSSTATYVASLLLSGQKKVMDLVSLKRILSTEKELLRLAADNDTVENLLHPLLLFSQNLSGNHRMKTEIMEFFLDLYSKVGNEESILQRSNVMVEWLCSLPDLLISIIISRSKLKGQGSNDQEVQCLNAVSENEPQDLLHLVLTCMRLASLRKKQEYIEGMESKTNLILSVVNMSTDLLFCRPIEQGTQWSYCEHCNALQSRILEVTIFYSSTLSEEDLTILTQVCHQVSISPENVRYVAEMVIHSLKKQACLSMFKFLFSILIGTSKEELEHLQVGQTQLNHLPESFVISQEEEESSIIFRRHQKIVHYICSILQNMDHVSLFLPVFLQEKLLKQYRTFPPNSTFAILESGRMVLRMETLSIDSREDLISCFGKFCGSCLIQCCNVENTKRNEQISEAIQTMVMSLFKEFPDLLLNCIKYYGTADFSSHSLSQAMCVVLDKVILKVDLNEQLLQLRDLVKDILDKVELNCPDATSMQWYKNTMNNFSIILRKETNT